MTTNQKIIGALKPFNRPVMPHLYDEEEEKREKEYFTFNYADDRAVEFADDAPTHTVHYMQIHLFLPLDVNNLKLKKEVRNALFQAGFTYPAITMQPENNKMHIIFECEIEEERED